MHSSRTIYRVPIPTSNMYACGLQRAIRNAHTAHSPFFSRGFTSPVLSNDFAPLFRVLDDQISRAFDFPTQSLRRVTPTYQPRFDVEEVEGGYLLRGEIPGVENRDLSVEFTDGRTLVIKGRTERQSSNAEDANVASAAAAETSTEQINALADISTTGAAAEADNDDARSVRSHSSTSSYVQPTVEDEETGTIERNVGASSTTEQQQSQQEQPQQQVAEQTQPEPTSRYWVSERSVGEFQRTFSFPERINQDGVTASLKNGVLNINVPKAAAPVARRILVE